MGNLQGRVERIEERLESEEGPGLRWPKPDGTFTEISGCRNLLNVYAKYVLPYERSREKSEVNHDDRIRRNPTK